MLCGPFLLQACNFCVRRPEDLQIQLISVNSSNVLIFMTRLALIMALLFFVQVTRKPNIVLSNTLKIVLFDLMT
jgi:hypothetical protein